MNSALKLEVIHEEASSPMDRVSSRLIFEMEGSREQVELMERIIKEGIEQSGRKSE